MTEIVGGVVAIIGACLVVCGVVIQIVEWLDERKAKREHRGYTTKGTSTADDLNALRKLIKLIVKQPLGAQLIIWGVVLVVIGLGGYRFG